jgi:hypothetical protein
LTQYTISSGTAAHPATVTANYVGISLVSGDLLVTGGYDTLTSGVSNVGIVLDNVFNVMTLAGNNDTINAGGPDSGYGDTLLETGNFNTIIDAGFGQGGITLAGSYNSLVSNQRRESARVVITGDHNNFENAYLDASLSIAGNYNVVDVGGGSVTISGNHDTVTVLNATTIITTGIGDVVMDDYLRDEPVAESFATSATGSPAFVSIGGSSSSVTVEDNNVSVNVSGDNVSVNAAGDLATVNASGNGVVIQASALLGSISVSGSNSTVTTSVAPLAAATAAQSSASGGVSITTVAFSGNASIGTTYSDGAPGAASAPTAPSVPVALTLTTSNASINTLLYSSVTDTQGGNVLTVGAASLVNVVAGNDVVQVTDGTYLNNASISGAQASNTINFGNNDIYQGCTTSFISTKNTLNLSGNDAAVVYAANQDTVNLYGNGNVLILQQNSALTDLAAQATAVGGASVVNVNGVSTALVETEGNAITGANGAQLIVTEGNNTITGQGLNALISGAGDQVVLTGSDTLISASPYTYQATPMTAPVQNQLTVQSGQFTLGGLDTLDQVSGSAAISLFGGNRVTLGGANDSVTVGDQIYGGNAITNVGAGNVVTLVDTNDAATTITAVASTLVNVADNAGSVIGGPNDNSDEHLAFIAGSGTSNTIFGASSNAAITLFGGQSAGNMVYGGAAGANSLNGGSGGGDYFKAGGAGDVLIGGAAGNNTLISSAGPETLVGAGLGNDAFSIAGGGGTDVIENFAGSLTVNGALMVASQTDIAGSLTVTLSDQTRISFTGVASLTNTGNVFTLT